MSDVSPTQKITLPNGKTLEAHTSLFINNKFVESIDGRRFETINPATEKPIVSIAEGTAADIDVAVDAALEAFEKVWQHVDGKERGRLLYKLTDLMMRDMEELGHLEALDTGKPIQNATGDVEDAADVLRYYAGWADKIHGKVIETSHEKFFYG